MEQEKLKTWQIAIYHSQMQVSSCLPELHMHKQESQSRREESFLVFSTLTKRNAYRNSLVLPVYAGANCQEWQHTHQKDSSSISKVDFSFHLLTYYFQNLQQFISMHKKYI